MKVTTDLIRQGQSFRAGWTPRQYEILGVGHPPPPGWQKLAVGREITAEQAEEFLRLKVPRWPGQR